MKPPANLFVFVIATTCIILYHDLTPRLTPTQHPSMQPHFTPTSSPPTPLHLIAVSILAINCLPRACRWASPQCTLRRERPSISTQTNPSTPTNTQPSHPFTKYTQEPWLYPPLPRTNERSPVGRAKAPHRLESRWYPSSIHSSNGLGCTLQMYV